MKLDEATFSNTQPNNARDCVTAILQYPSVILSSCNVAPAIRHNLSTTRQRTVQLMIQKHLLHEDDYLVRKLTKKLKVVRGFSKQVPVLNDEQSCFNYTTILHEFGISRESFYYFLDPSKNGTIVK